MHNVKVKLTMSYILCRGAIYPNYYIIPPACSCLSNTVLSQQCYNQPNCTGDVVPGPTTAEECCVGTDDGMSFGDSGGTCTVSQCVGNEYKNIHY